ncbi:helix-turn-helix transcriptional regulator [Priestia aryabhattai]|uniref:helix-turn-helix transcriptional regulator n=1 Tax=Priestia aryabhattai TaxID=412384 RepID=UPI0021086F0C|nr:helix-turn-helix transcriptional regulator [Priestia aryabhattai]
MHEKITQLRVSRGWTQTELARHLKVTRSHVNKLEKGKTNLSLALLERIADVFNVSIKDFF